MIRELCIGEDVKESGWGLLLGTIPTSVERLSKMKKTSVRIAGLWDGILTRNLPNAKKEP
jgi:hypothetical protein